MPTLLQINITANWGAHGRIAELIGQQAMAQGWESHIAYGRWKNPSQSQLYHIGNQVDEAIHLMSARLFDNQGLMSHGATRQLINYMRALNPTIVHLHNLHGYYLNYPMLFRYLSTLQIPVVWTFHDAWPFTGHCAHYMYADCEKWKTHCAHCPLLTSYPRCVGFDRSYANFETKRKWFRAVSNLCVVPVSKWLEGEVRASFLSDCACRQIYNGIDTQVFHIDEHAAIEREAWGIAPRKKMVLGVASNWYRKGLDDFVALRKLLPDDYVLVMVGGHERLYKHLATGMVGIARTNDVAQLRRLYTTADVFFNPTWEDNLPTTILEALACGTPVVTYHTGGCSEEVPEGCGYVVEKGAIVDAKNRIEDLCRRENAQEMAARCRQHVIDHFEQGKQLKQYLALYNQLLAQS